MRVVIRGAGDLASGVALRLWRAGMDVVLLDVEKPTAIRRTVCFSQAIVLGRTEVEGVAAVLAADAAEAESLLAQEVVPVLADPDCRCRQALRPDAEAHIMLRDQVGTIECEARQRAAALEERTAGQMKKTLDLFHQQYQMLMSTFETASSHMTAELRKMEVSLAQLPRTMDQTGKELNQLASTLERADHSIGETDRK